MQEGSRTSPRLLLLPLPSPAPRQSSELDLKEALLIPASLGVSEGEFLGSSSPVLAAAAAAAGGASPVAPAAATTAAAPGLGALGAARGGSLDESMAQSLAPSDFEAGGGGGGGRGVSHDGATGRFSMSIND